MGQQGSVGSSGVKADGRLRLQARHGSAVIGGAQDLVEVHQAGRLIDRRRRHPLQDVRRLLHLDGALNRLLGARRDRLLLPLVIDAFLQAGSVED